MSNARRWLVQLALVATAACGTRETKPESYRLADVVAPAIQALEARVAPSASPATEPANAEVRERLVGLIESLGSTEARLRNIAIEEARTLSAEDLTVVAQLLADEAQDATLRDGAARLLGESPTPASGDALCTTLEKSRTPSVRRQCAFQLGRVAQTHLVPRLLLRLKYEVDAETVAWLAHALSRYGNLSGLAGVRVLATTSREENVVTLAAQIGADLAAEFGAPDLDTLERRWRSGEFEASRPAIVPDERTRLEGWRRIERLSHHDLRQVDDARFTLVALDQWVVADLAAALHDTNAYTRVYAAQCLERRGQRSRSAVDALIDALSDVRGAPMSASALGSIGEARATPALVAALEHGASLDLRVAAARALGTLAARDALEPLARAFGAKQPADLRQAAAEALLAIDARAEAFDYLKAQFSARSGDVAGAEAALGRHIAALASHDFSARALDERWRALDVKADAIATVAETEVRQRARGALLR